MTTDGQADTPPVARAAPPPPHPGAPVHVAIDQARAETLAQILGTALTGRWTDSRPGEVRK